MDKKNIDNKNITVSKKEDVKLSQSEMVSKIIEDNANFEKIKAVPKNRWFNSIMVILLSIIPIFIGIIIGCLIIIFV